MITRPRPAVLRGEPRFVGELAGSVVVLDGTALYHRWRQSGTRLADTRSRAKLKAKAGQRLVLWGRGLDETEPVTVTAVNDNAVTLERRRPVTRDGEVRVVRWDFNDATNRETTEM